MQSNVRSFDFLIISNNRYVWCGTSRCLDAYIRLRVFFESVTYIRSMTVESEYTYLSNFEYLACRKRNYALLKNYFYFEIDRIIISAFSIKLLLISLTATGDNSTLLLINVNNKMYT